MKSSFPGKRPCRVHGGIALAALLAFAGPVHASDPAASAPPTFITLGTMGGPIPHPERSQPANVLIVGEEAHLIDAGDGAAQRLAGAGVRLTQLRTVFISHLHFDHTGGLGAILGLRYQTNVPGELTIYGPPGTRRLVEGIIASMRPGSESGYGIPGTPHAPPERGIRVEELTGRSVVQLDGIRVSTAENSHYSFPVGSPEADRYKSLSFRFDLPGRSIVYTGDTGPSEAVERLARDADLLVAEMIDLDATIENVRRNNPSLPPQALSGVVRHLSDHHLSPEQVGEMAAAANVRRLVITHIVPGSVSAEDHARYLTAIRSHYRGEAAIANDLDRF